MVWLVLQEEEVVVVPMGARSAATVLDRVALPVATID